MNTTEKSWEEIEGLPSTSKDDANVLSLREYYRGKVLFVTGCTGFLGKVLLEKILRCLPEVKRVYVLVRAKKGGSPKDRLVQEILKSRIMDVLRQKMGSEQFDAFALEKLVAVPGDVATPEFIHLPEDELNAIRSEVHVVLHSAATVGFQEPLNDAIRLNTFGAFGALKFAQSCPNVQVFSHISTCYVNSHMKSGSRVQEKQYPLKLPGNEDPEDFCRRVLQMNQEEAEKTSVKYLKYFKYPNTYTFTKRLGETLVAKNRGNVKVAIIRPSIVGAALKEPVPGWVDTVSAGGAVYLFAGLGVLSILPADTNKISDQIPVDYVANGMLIATADVGSASTNLCRTYHLGTSQSRPGTWGNTETGIMKYWRSHRPKKSIGPASFKMIKNTYLLNTYFYLQYTWIAQVYSIFAAAIRNKKHMKMAMNLHKLASRANMFHDTFKHFTLNEWIFENPNLEHAYARMPADEQRVFFLDWNSIDWNTYFEYFCYGLHRYVLKEEPDTTPTSGNVLDANKTDLFSDISFVFSAAGEFNARWSRGELKRVVLGSARVQKEIQKEAEKRSIAFGEVEDRALAIMERMFADPNMKTVRFFSWALRKIWRKLYRAIVVDHEEIERVRSMVKNKSENGALVFIPTHRSYIDFLVLSYIFFAYDIPVPHVAAGEDFLNMFLIRNMFRHSGAFFIRRSFGTDDLYKTIFSEYVQHLLMDGCPVEFFVEGTRSRNGKTLHPKLGLLSIIAESYLDKKVSNITIVPVNISYERLLEGEAYSNELLGVPKKKESLSALIKARDVLKNRYGDIHVKFSSPISLKEYANSMAQENLAETFDPFFNSTDRFRLIRRLAYSITHELNESAVCMPTALVATILLTYRDGISLDELTVKTNFFKKQVLLRGGRLNWGEQQSTSAVIDRALSLLSNLVVTRKYMIEPAIDNKADYKKILQLSCYRNTLIHIFVRDALASCALESFGAAKNEGVLRSDLVDSIKFLGALLQVEFVFSNNPEIEEDYNTLIDVMIQREIFKSKTDEEGREYIYIVATHDNEMHRFLCNLLWPFIETYWATAMTMLSLQFSGSESESLSQLKESVLLERIQWLAEKFFFDNRLYFYESCSMDTIKNAIATFLTWKVIKRVKKETEVKKGETKIDMYLFLLPPYTEMDKLFDLVEKIQRYRRTQPLAQRLTLERKVNMDFQLPSKL